jgi:hypothetical protein
MFAAADPSPPPIVVWRYVGYALAALVVMVAVILSHDRFAMNLLHVMTGVLWTGIDLFMGFVIGPILRRVDLAARKQIIVRLVPKTLFLMPTLATVTGTTGWYLAKDLAYFDLAWPAFGWVVAALVLVALMTVQGLGYLLPTNLRVCLELRKPAPDADRIGRWMRSYFLAVAMQGTMQVATIVIMARFVTGL